jgi:hypothetical protein
MGASLPPYVPEFLSRSAVRFSPKSLPDGALPASFAFDTGQPATAFASPTSPSPLIISGGRVAHVPYAGAQSAGYMQVRAAGRVTRIGCEVAWPAGSLGVLALVIPSSPWSSGVLPNAGFHFVTTGNSVWTLSRFTTGGSTTIADYTTHGRANDARNLGLVPLDIWLDPPNNKAVICWWDGSRTVVNNAFIGSETADYGIFELFENNGATDTPAVLGDVWVDATPRRWDGPANLPIEQLFSTSPVAYNVTGTLNPDFTKSIVHQATLVGNITSMTFQNVPPPNQIFELHLIQDATGSRTLSGVSNLVRWAGGGSAPTLTTTAGRRDIFTFRAYQSIIREVSRSMDVT